MSEHDDVLEFGNCKTCNYAFRDESAQGRFHCGLTYYQVPPAQRRPVKLTSYPVVTPEHVCIHWMPKVISK
jgi:hypothetical protein